MKLRCDVSGVNAATTFSWYDSTFSASIFFVCLVLIEVYFERFKNDAPIFEEPDRVKVQTKLKGDLLTSTLRFSTLETLDTAFYECKATNGQEAVSSVAIVTVKLGKLNLNTLKDETGDDDGNEERSGKTCFNF